MEENPNKNEKIPMIEKVGYGLGDTATNFVYQAMNMFIVFFYTDVFGISAAVIGVMFFVCRMWDAVSDPLMGAISDRTNTRWGKFRPWILWTAIPFAIVSIAMFTTPNLSVNGKIVYAFVTYFLMMTVFTANNIPYSALSGVMTSNINERTSISSYRFLFAMIAAFAVQGMTIPLVKSIGANDTSIVQATIEDNTLVLTEIGTGTSQIELTATDAEGNEKSFEILAKIYDPKLRPPQISKNLEEKVYQEGFSSDQISLDGLFYYPGDEALIYKATTGNKKVLKVSVEGDTLNLEEKGIGNVTVTINAKTASGASVDMLWNVSVNQKGNSIPLFKENIAEITLEQGFENKEIELTNWVTDADSDELSFFATVSDREVVSVEAAVTTMRIREKSTGKTNITLHVNDRKGGKAKLTLPITIHSASNNVPHIENPIGTIELSKGFGTHKTNLDQLFVDLDEEPVELKLKTYNAAKGYKFSMILYSIIAAILFIVTFSTTKERVSPPKNQKPSIKSDLKSLFTNVSWVIIFFVGLFNFIYITFRSSAIIYYFKYYVGNDDLFGPFNIVGLIALIAGIALAKPLSQKFGKKWIYIIAKLLIGLSTLAFVFINPEDIVMIFALQIIGSFFSGQTIPLLWSMVGDVADYSEWKTGRRATGMTFSGVTFSFKFGQGIGGALTGFFLASFGYIANAEQSAESLLGIKLMMSLFPAIASFMVVALLLFYKLDGEKMAKISKALEQRRATAA